MRNCSIRVLAILPAFLMVINAFGLRGGQKEKVETREITTPIPCEVRYEFSRNVGAGRLAKEDPGTPGLITDTYRVWLLGGKVEKKQLLHTERVEAKPAMYLMGTAGYEASRHEFYIRTKVKTMVASGYNVFCRGRHARYAGRTRTGIMAKYGIVAVDPRVIPLGTLLYVEGYGFALAADTGSAIKGNRIDLCFQTKHEADTYGLKPVQVHILKTR